MKKIILFLLVLTVLSCSKEDNIDLTHENENIDTRQERITTVPLFDPCDAQNLFVFVDLSVCLDETLWDCAINNAIAAYNDLPNNIGIGMTIITNMDDLPEGEAINITINCTTANLGGGGRTGRRTTAQDVSGIQLETNFENNWPCPNQTPNCCQMQKIVMHELGHAFGFGHTEGGTQDAAWIPGTPMGEANSIFNVSATDDWCNTICDFTTGDLIALEALYPTLFNITGDSDICVNETSMYCLDPDLDVQWTSPISSTSNCIDYTAPGLPTSVLLSAIVTDNGCEYEINKVINVHTDEQCNPPSQAPYDFSEICIGEFAAVCYDFSDWDCVETIEIESSSRKLIVDIDGTEVCLSYIWTRETTIQLEVTFISWCGDSETVNWAIDIVDCDNTVIITDPPHEDPPTSGPTAEYCRDNPCPCETVSDCPPGWKCIGGGGKGFCIEL